MKLSIVTPSFNQGRFIERTLASVEVQDVGPVEHVVFDGGSRDETVVILSRYGDRIRWRSEPDNGQTHAVNKGLAATSGDVVGWLNSDDVYYPGAFRTVLAYFEAHPEVDAVYGMADHIDVDDKPFEPYPTEPWNFERLTQTCYLCQPAVFFRRRVVKQHGLLDETLRYCMDYEYWLRLALGGARFAYLEHKLAGSRLYADAKTLRDRPQVHAEINSMLRRRLSRVPDSWLYGYAHAVVGSRLDRSRHPRRFAVEVGVRSLLAAIRWNARISRDMTRKTAHWIASSAFAVSHPVTR
jgi:glycosyltransferase involved in cell wall biosynthesis